MLLTYTQDRESEPRFTGPPAARGGYEGGAGRGGYGGGGGGGGGFGGPPSGNGRQIFVNNVCPFLHCTIFCERGVDSRTSYLTPLAGKI